jgi:4,5-DOPA dioxygenase extradiol
MHTPDRMPVLFIGHGNPMNAILENRFSDCLASLGKRIPRPRAILCVSAHWMTKGTWITRMPSPRTIHDFYGFPQSLFDVQYPAPGSPDIADAIRNEIKSPVIQADDTEWGLDHGSWAILKHLYPQADIPVLQLSLDMTRPALDHLRIGTHLKSLRDQGILIIGSGNIVHNLRTIDFDTDAKPFQWAIDFDQWVKEKVIHRDFELLAKDGTSSEIGRLSIPTPDHWYPLFYVLGASDPSDRLRFEYEGIENASISMRCFSFGFDRD